MGDGDTAYDDDRLDFLPVAADFEYAADMEVEDDGSDPPPGGSPRSEPAATASRQQQQQQETKTKASRPTDPRKLRQQTEEFGLKPSNDSDGDRHTSRRSSKHWSPEASHRRRSRSPGPHSKRNNSRSPRRHRSRSRSPRRRDPRGDPRRSRQESLKSRSSRHEENQPKRSRDDERSSHKRGSRTENGAQQQAKVEHSGGDLASARVAAVETLPVQPVQESEEPFGDIYESSPAKVDATAVSSSDSIVQNGTYKQLQQDDENCVLDTYVSERDPVPEASSPLLTLPPEAADNRSSPKHGSEDEAEPVSKQLTPKDKKALMLLRVAVADYVKEALKPTWKEGQMAKDVYKTIVKKAVDKVLSTLKSHQIPRSREKVDHFMTFSRQKISKLVQGYVEKYQKK